MRRLVIIGTALAVLVGAAAAYAATHFNSYNGTKLAISKGSKSPLSMAETLKATAPPGDRAAPLTKLVIKIYGVKLDQGKLPVCTDAKIEQNKTKPDGGCSTGSLVGSGTTHALLGPLGNSSAATSNGVFACNVYIHIFNGGPKTQVDYYYTKAATDCGGLTTGSTAPFDGHISYSGGYAVITTPLPPDISTKVANLPNYWSSLIAQTINFGSRVNGKVYMAGTGCKSGKRPWSVTYTNMNYGGGSDTQTVKGSSPC